MPSLRLSGIVISGDLRLATLSHDKQEDFRTLREGDEIEGWRVAAIERRAVRLTRGGDTVALALLDGGPQQGVVKITNAHLPPVDPN